jgi:methylglutaconyl-CoA hydratase
LSNSAKTVLLSETKVGDSFIAVVSLNRPDSAGALNAQLLAELTQTCVGLKTRTDVRVVILHGLGKHFSAGADLNWMAESAKLSHQENIADARKLMTMFEALANLPQPLVVVTHGAAFGGALGMLACGDIVIAAESAKFSLSEVRLGLLPAVIVPYLSRRVRAGDLRRLGMTAKVFETAEAVAAGLVDEVATDVNGRVRSLINELLVCGPEAQRRYKSLLKTFELGDHTQRDATLEAIATARTGVEGQAGLNAFLQKKPAPWLATLPEDWRLP